MKWNKHGDWTSWMMRGVFIAAVLGAVSCGGGGSPSSRSAEPPVSDTPVSSAPVGLWRGSFMSSLTATTEPVTIVSDGVSVFIEMDVKSAAGTVDGDEQSMTGELAVYRHHGASVYDIHKSPAFGFIENRHIEFAAGLGSSGELSGSYRRFDGEVLVDQGTITALRQTTAGAAPYALPGYSNYQFHCGVDTSGYSLYCYSTIAASIDENQDVSGSYEDKFLYPYRPAGIPSSIPGTFIFSGALDSSLGPGIWSAAVTMEDTDYEGVVFWLNGSLRLLSVSVGGARALRL